jgi:hypothetical protein
MEADSLISITTASSPFVGADAMGNPASMEITMDVNAFAIMYYTPAEHREFQGEIWRSEAKAQKRCNELNRGISPHSLDEGCVYLYENCEVMDV